MHLGFCDRCMHARMAVHCPLGGKLKVAPVCVRLWVYPIEFFYEVSSPNPNIYLIHWTVIYWLDYVSK